MKCEKCGAMMVAQGENRFACDFCGSVFEKPVQNNNPAPATNLQDENLQYATVKKCPYCGEEILATARKCKHCGEWLDGTGNVKVTEITKNSTPHPNYKWLINTCLVAIFLIVISVFLSLWFLSIDATFDNKWTYLPTLMTMICGILEVYFFLGLRKSLRAYNKSKGIPIGAYFVLILITIFLVILFAFFIFLDFKVKYTDFETITYKIINIIAILAVLSVIAVLIMQFVLGAKLCTLHETSKIGISFIIRGVLSLLGSIIIFGNIVSGSTGISNININNIRITAELISIVLSSCSLILYCYFQGYFFNENETE